MSLFCFAFLLRFFLLFCWGEEGTGANLTCFFLGGGGGGLLVWLCFFSLLCISHTVIYFVLLLFLNSPAVGGFSSRFDCMVSAFFCWAWFLFYFNFCLVSVCFCFVTWLLIQMRVICVMIAAVCNLFLTFFCAGVERCGANNRPPRCLTGATGLRCSEGRAGNKTWRYSQGSGHHECCPLPQGEHRKNGLLGGGWCWGYILNSFSPSYQDSSFCYNCKHVLDHRERESSWGFVCVCVCVFTLAHIWHMVDDTLR